MTEGDVWHTEQQRILHGSKASFWISLQSLAFSTHHRNHRKFNLNAKQQRKRYLCFFTVLLKLSMRLWPISSWALLHRSRWPVCCLWLAAWYIQFVPNKDGSPLCSCPVRPTFPPAVVFLLFCDLTVAPKEICDFSSDLLFCLNTFECDLREKMYSYIALFKGKIVLLWTI